MLGMGSREELQIINQMGKCSLAERPCSGRRLMALGSVMHMAHEGDVIFGTGIRSVADSAKNARRVTLTAVRGPVTRRELLKMGAAPPSVYGDPALLAPFIVWPTLRPNASASSPVCVLPHALDTSLHAQTLHAQHQGMELRLLDAGT